MIFACDSGSSQIAILQWVPSVDLMAVARVIEQGSFNQRDEREAQIRRDALLARSMQV